MNEKLVYSGKLYRVYTWDQEMFDGSVEVFEKAVRKPSVQLVVVDDSGKFLIFDEKQPSRGEYSSLPGGMVEWDEDFLDGARRELLEETGFVGDFEEFHESNFGVSLVWTTKYYVVRNVRKVQEPIYDVGEKISYDFVSFDDFVDRVLSSDFKNKYFSNFILLKKMSGSLNNFRDFCLGLK